MAELGTETPASSANGDAITDAAAAAGDASMDVVKDESRSEEYNKLVAQGLKEKVASKVEEIINAGKLVFDELDVRALDALKEFPVEGALTVLEQFVESNLDHVSNKSAYLCGMMKTYRQKQKNVGPIAGSVPGVVVPAAAKGPDEEKIKAILQRTGYSLDVTTGQRKYGGPPPGWEGPEPGAGCEVFCGKIPKEVFEDELVLLFEKSGKIYDLRLMMDPMTGTNRGYGFVTYTTKEEAEQAAKDLDNYEIKPGRKLKVNVSVPNLRLFVGNIPKSKGKEDILTEFGKLTAGLADTIIYCSPDDKKKNRGFCFLEYESHKAASAAKKKLSSRPMRVWNCDIIVDWADPQDEPDSETMSKVKVLYVRNLKTDYDEEKLQEVFGAYGPIQRIKKLKDYAFVHYEEREHAITAMNELHGKDFGGVPVEVSLAKPPSDKKKKEEMLRARERRMASVLHPRGGSMIPSPGRSGGALGRRPPPMLGARDYDYDYDYYGPSSTAGVGYGGGYQAGYGDSYYDDYYYDDYYYDYSAPPPRGGRGGRQPPPPGRGPPPRAVPPRGRVPPPRAGGPFGGRGGRRKFQGKRKADGGGGVGGGGENKRRFQQAGVGVGGAGVPQVEGDQGLNGGGAGDQWYQDQGASMWQ